MIINSLQPQELDQMVSNHDVVISFVPPTMHMPVAKSCLKNGKHLTTSSYISPEMEALDADVKKKGLIFLNESGLDPGIDIMSTIKVLDEAKHHGWKIVAYESYCGGLPVAEQADNPLGYKFSWNPGAAIKASKNKSIFLKNKKRMEVDEPLKCVEDRDDISVAMKLEVYPNRNSLTFMDKWKMNDCETFIRGTIRFKGFSYIISAFHDLGLTSDLPVPSGVKTLRDLAESRLKDACPSKAHPLAAEALNQVMMGVEKDDEVFIKKFLSKVDLSYMKQNEILFAFKSIIRSLRFLGFLTNSPSLNTVDKAGKARTYLDVFGEVLADKLSMNDDDRDLVVMRHNFILEDQKKQRWDHYSTLIASGNSKN